MNDVSVIRVQNLLYVQFKDKQNCVLLNLKEWTFLERNYDKLENYYYFGNGCNKLNLSKDVFIKIENPFIFLFNIDCCIELSVFLFDYKFYKRLNIRLEESDDSHLYHF